MNAAESKAADVVARLIDVCDVLASFSANTDAESFADDTATQWAVEMGLIRIGEGITRLPAGVLTTYPDQPWRLMVAMRNFAAHQYDDLDPHRVWRTLTRDVPALRRYLADTVLPGVTQ